MTYTKAIFFVGLLSFAAALPSDYSHASSEFSVSSMIPISNSFNPTLWGHFSVNPSRTQVIHFSYDRPSTLIDLATSSQTLAHEMPSGHVDWGTGDLAFVSSASGDGLWSLSEKRFKYKLSGEGVIPFPWSQDHKYIFERISNSGLNVRDLDGRIVWSKTYPRILSVFNYGGHPDWVGIGATSLDDKQVSHELLNLATLTTFSLPIFSEEAFDSLEVSPDGLYFALIRSESRRAEIWTLDGRKVFERSLARESRESGLEWSPNGRYLALVVDYASVELIDTTTGISYPVANQVGFGQALNWSPSGNILNVAGKMYDVTDPKSIREIPINTAGGSYALNSIVFLDNSRFLSQAYSRNSAGERIVSLVIWKLRSKR